MVTNARTVVEAAFNLVGNVGRGFQTMSGPKGATGLRLLNQAISVLRYEPRLIPYYNGEYPLTQVANQRKYNIPNLVSIETVAYYIDSPGQTVWTPCYPISRTDYFGGPRVDGIDSITFGYHAEPILNGYDIYFYFVPNQNYQVKICGKFVPGNVEMDDDLDLIFNETYIEYLTYQTAIKIGANYNIPLQADVQRLAERLENIIFNFNPPDYEVQIPQMTNGPIVPGLGDAYIGKGFRPS